MKIYEWMFLIVATFLFAEVSAGGDPAQEQDAEGLMQRAKFSKLVERELAERGVYLAIVGRVGRPEDQLPKGVKFTHVGIAVYSTMSGEDGKNYPGYAFYNLYQSSKTPSRSQLVIDAPSQFFATTSTVKAGVIIPTAELQRRLLKILTTKHYAALHRQPYSVISNPYTLDFQNCTEFVADLITAAIYDTENPLQIKANQRAYFKPVKLRLSKAKLTVASLFSSGVSLSDHDGPVQIATFQAIANFLERHAALKESFVLCDAQKQC